MASCNETWTQSDENIKSKSIHHTSNEGHAPSNALFFDLAIFWNFFHVEFQEDDLRAVLRDDLSIRTQDVNSPDMRFRSCNGDHASQLPIVPLQRFVDNDDDVIDSQVSMSLCPFLPRVEKREISTGTGRGRFKRRAEIGAARSVTAAGATTAGACTSANATLRSIPSRATSGRVVL